jgi:ubiquinone/menaquinone biosynthesis C-methylase UbiE
MKLASQECRVVGIDSSAHMLGQLPCHGDFELLRCVAEVLPFSTGTFDRVFCINAFHHFNDKGGFLAEAQRVLRPGGGLMTVSLDPHTELDKWWIYDYFENSLELDKQRYISGKGIREMLAAAGFVNCRTESMQRMTRSEPARTSIEGGYLARTVTSQLAILTDAEYNRGVQRIQEDIVAAERDGQELRLIADLHLYATTAWLPLRD